MRWLDPRANGRRNSVRIKIGEVGQIKTREARAKAKAILGSIGRGVLTRSQRPSRAKQNGPGLVNSTGPTLRAAASKPSGAIIKRKGPEPCLTQCVLIPSNAANGLRYDLSDNGQSFCSVTRSRFVSVPFFPDTA